MSLTPSRKSSSGQRRCSVGTSGGSGRYSHSDASSIHTYLGRVRAAEGSLTARTYPSTPRRQTKQAACSDNHGIRPPTPEQYLTPLQQKEVCIRHLRARLRDNVERLQHRDFEIDELRAQLFRMQEDWIEEECHRVEAQLALKDARKEIQHLQEVVESVRSNLSVREQEPHDNRPYLRLQGAPPVGRSRSCGCSPASTLSRSTACTRRSSDALQLEPRPNAPESSRAPRPAGQTHLILEAALLSEQLPAQGLGQGGPTVPRSSTYERLCSGGTVLPMSHSCQTLGSTCKCSGHAYLPHHHLFLHLPQEEAPVTLATAVAPASEPIPTPVGDRRPEVRSQACSPTMSWLSEDAGELNVISVATAEITPSEPRALPLSLPPLPTPEPSYGCEPPPRDKPEEKTETPEEPHPCQPLPFQPHTCQPLPFQPHTCQPHPCQPHICQPRPCQPLPCQPLPCQPHAMAPLAELVVGEDNVDASGSVNGDTHSAQVCHWSRYFFIDLLALAMPVVPTMAWLCHGAPREVMPVYQIGSLLRGCCAVALHSLRRRGADRGPVGVNGTTTTT